MSARSDKPRIRLFSGQWYAFGKNTPGGRLLLVPAIRFAQQLNRRAAA